MIVLRVQGGLGNQMFQYALGRYLEHARGVDVAYDVSSYKRDQKRDYALPVWRAQPRVLEDNELAVLPGRYGGLGWKALLVGERPLRRVKERPFGFHPRFHQTPPHAYLDGYWQSERFFPGMRDQLAEEFQPARPVSLKSVEVARRIERVDAVAVHVRRTDYLTLPFMQVCGLDYYRRCVGELLARHAGLELFVFSDDLAWCEENLAFDCPTRFVGHNGAANAHEDLWLMSLCRRHVIPNSSFSWWAAWLRQDQAGEVYAPRPWFADPKWNGADIAPERWLTAPDEAPPLRRAA